MAMIQYSTVQVTYPSGSVREHIGVYVAVDGHVDLFVCGRGRPIGDPRRRKIRFDHADAGFITPEEMALTAEDDSGDTVRIRCIDPVIVEA